MKLFIFLTLAGIVQGFFVLESNNDLDPLWKSYKKAFEKSYAPLEEYVRRFIWENHVRDITRHNIRADLGDYSFKRGLNEYSDMSLKEHMKYLTGYRSTFFYKSGEPAFVPQSDIWIPDSVDWRNEGLVTPIKNQKLCGACWAFSATGSLEGQHKKKTGKLVALSEQNLLDCSNGNDGCYGGSIDASLDYVKNNNGIDTETSYPYEAMNGTCRFKKTSIGATCEGRVNLPEGDEEALKQAVASVGPVSVIIDACHNTFISYKSGIFDEPECRTDIPSHAVLVVGYGTENNIDYWLVKNSWGESWGMQGYIKMSRNKNNQCGIASLATYPLV